MGYTAKRTIRQDFPDLGPDIWVEIKNPVLCSPDELDTRRQPKQNKQGVIDRDDAAMLSFEMLAGLVTSWNVPDPDDDNDDAPSMPVSGDSMGKAPVAIISWIGEQINGAIDPS